MEVTRRPAVLIASANFSGVMPYMPAVSTCVSPMRRTIASMAAGSVFACSRNDQSCTPTGGPCARIRLTLPADDALAEGEPVDAACAHADADTSTATAASDRTLNDIIVTP